MKINTDFYNLTPYKNLLIIESFSSWDERVAIQHIKDLRNLVMRLYKNKSWAALHDSREWKLGTPGAEYLLANMVSADTSLAPAYHAMVVSHNQLPKWQISNIFKNVTKFENKYFTIQKEAVNWLASYGYTMAPL